MMMVYRASCRARWWCARARRSWSCSPRRGPSRPPPCSTRPRPSGCLHQRQPCERSFALVAGAFDWSAIRALKRVWDRVLKPRPLTFSTRRIPARGWLPGLLRYLLLLAAQHVRQLVFTHKLGQRQASVVLAARVVEVRMVKNS
jgi:hypothetical protein